MLMARPDLTPRRGVARFECQALSMGTDGGTWRSVEVVHVAEKVEPLTGEAVVHSPS
jgi:hypothetical protein